MFSKGAALRRVLVCAFVSAAAAAVIVACTPQSGTLSELVPSSFTASTSPASGGRAADAGDDAASEDDDNSTREACANEPAVDASRRDLVCHRWRCDGRAGVNGATWSGNAAACSAGDVDADASDRAVQMINLHRFLADVPSVTLISSWSPAAQKCALLAHANAALSHEPPRDWKCWSDLGALTSSISLIANRSAPIAINAFIQDPANDTTMVHRRWLLSENLTHVGVGSTDRYACVVVDGDELGKPPPSTTTTLAATSDKAPRGWAAWPPQGPVPIEVFTAETIDEIGWTVQSSEGDLDLPKATVTVTSSDGTNMPVAMSHLTPLYGSRSAIRFVPIGWRTEAGHSYSVSVRAGATKIDYVVEPTDC